MRFPTFHVILITEYHVLPTIISIMSSLSHIVFIAMPYEIYATYKTKKLVVSIFSNVQLYNFKNILILLRSSVQPSTGNILWNGNISKLYA